MVLRWRPAGLLLALAPWFVAAGGRQGTTSTTKVAPAWRKPDLNGRACVSCHSPDGLEIAAYDFSDAEIVRRARAHLSEEDSSQIVNMIHSVRSSYHIKTLLNPMTDRPMQPGGAVLPGQTPMERDGRFIAELQTAVPSFFARRIGSLAAAKAARDQILAVDLPQLKIGIPMNRLSEDEFHGKEHATIADWLPDVPLARELPTDLQDAYLADPSDRNYRALDHALAEMFAQQRSPAQYLSLLKRRSMLYFQHAMRTRMLVRLSARRPKSVTANPYFSPPWEWSVRNEPGEGGIRFELTKIRFNSTFEVNSNADEISKGQLGPELPRYRFAFVPQDSPSSPTEGRGLGLVSAKSELLLNDEAEPTAHIESQRGKALALPEGINPMWALGEFGRQSEQLKISQMGMPIDIAAKKISGTDSQGQMRELRLPWYWLGWTLDPGLQRTLPSLAETTRADYFTRYLWSDGPYPMHMAFMLTRKIATESFVPAAWNSGSPQHLDLNYSEFLKDQGIGGPLPTDPKLRTLFQAFVENSFRMNLYFQIDELSHTHTVYLREGLTQQVRRMKAVFHEPRDIALVDQTLGLISRSQRAKR